MVMCIYPRRVNRSVWVFKAPSTALQDLFQVKKAKGRQKIAMSEHRGSSFAHSCVKVPVDPYTRQPTPSYERPRIQRVHKSNTHVNKNRRINFVSSSSFNQDSHRDNASSDDSNMESFLEFIDSIPDYGEVNHLSNEQFKQKLDYLKRKQRMLLKNLKNCLDEDDRNVESPIIQENKSTILSPKSSRTPHKSNRWNETNEDLKLLGKKCSLENSRTGSPLLYSSGTFAGLAEDQDLLTYRGKDDDKSLKTLRNREICSGGKSWSTWSESKSIESADSDSDSVETRSLPPASPKRWQPTLPKPFSFALRDETEKYMSQTEADASEILRGNNKGGPMKKRRVRPIPLTSRIPLYDKLMAAKEERSRIIREESAWSLMSQVKPFKLECDRRAVRAMSRSSPELCSRNFMRRSMSRFKAKPVPKNLFGTDVYDRMLEDEYLRQVEKKIRAAELMKSSSLPPSMARRERIKSAGIPRTRNCSNDELRRIEESSRICSVTPMTSERSRSAITDLSGRGNNLAAILRCQASREKLEREIREKMEEKARDYAMKLRESMISRKPAWRALRHTARKELARDLDFRASLRRDEAREQAERHRLEMEMMLDRVTQIPTLFERHSQMENDLQSFQAMRQLQSRACKPSRRKKKLRMKSEHSSSTPDTDISRGCVISPPDSASLTSTTRISPGCSIKSSVCSRKSQCSTNQLDDCIASKKKSERGPLRVSINETAELIEDDDNEDENERYSVTPSNTNNMKHFDLNNSAENANE